VSDPEQINSRASRIAVWRGALAAAFRSPSAKQKELYGRYFHTLSAAAAIGATTVLFAEVHPTPFVVVGVVGAAVIGVVLFLFGAVLSRGNE
jgi:hypothetical protein